MPIDKANSGNGIGKIPSNVDKDVEVPASRNTIAKKMAKTANIPAIIAVAYCNEHAKNRQTEMTCS